jgi:hypothetical protein
MTTLFVVCFIAGLGLSVVSFLSGFDEITLFEHVFHGHGHRGVHLPRVLHPKKGRSSMINVATITAFLTWFGGGGLLLERLTPFAPMLVVGGAAVIGLAGGSLVNRVIGALARRESTAESLSMIGVIAKTVVPIRAGDGTGEIVFTHAGTRRVAGARSDDGTAIDKGVEVVVTRYEKGIAYVTTWETLSKEAAHNA